MSHRKEAREQFNKNRKIIIREVPPVTYEDVKKFMGRFTVSNIAISKRQRHSIVELKFGWEAESAVEELDGKKLVDCSVRVSLFRQDNLICLENLPMELTEEQFMEIVKPYGVIEKSFLWVDKDDSFLGYGFVEYAHNRGKSEEVRSRLDGIRVLASSDRISRCRFVRDNVTSFDQLQSSCLIVTNLPPNFGINAFNNLLLQYGDKDIGQQINSQVGVMMNERFGVVEYCSGDVATLMLRQIDRSHCYNSGEQNNTTKDGFVLRAWLCTPGESVDQIMKDMTSVSSTKLNLTTPRQSDRSLLELIHPEILSSLKDDPNLLHHFTTILQRVEDSHTGGIGSSHIGNFHFQVAVLCLMVAHLEGSKDSFSQNTQELQQLAERVASNLPQLSSVSTTRQQISAPPKQNNFKQIKSSMLNQYGEHLSGSLISSFDGRLPLSTLGTNDRIIPSVPVLNDLVPNRQTSVNHEPNLCEIFQSTTSSSTPCDGFSSTASLNTSASLTSTTSASSTSTTSASSTSTTSVSSTSTTSDILTSTTSSSTSPWKLLPSFLKSKSISMLDSTTESSNEPYLGFESDLIFVTNYLQCNRSEHPKLLADGSLPSLKDDYMPQENVKDQVSHQKPSVQHQHPTNQDSRLFNSKLVNETYNNMMSHPSVSNPTSTHSSRYFSHNSRFLPFPKKSCEKSTISRDPECRNLVAVKRKYETTGTKTAKHFRIGEETKKIDNSTNRIPFSNLDQSLYRPILPTTASTRTFINSKTAVEGSNRFISSVTRKRNVEGEDISLISPANQNVYNITGVSRMANIGNHLEKRSFI